MSVNSLGFGEELLGFLLSTGGMAVIACCAAYAALIVWMVIGFGSSGHPPVPRN